MFSLGLPILWQGGCGLKDSFVHDEIPLPPHQLENHYQQKGKFKYHQLKEHGGGCEVLDWHNT